MDAIKKIKLFFISLGFFACVTAFFVSGADPYRVFNSPWQLNTQTHLNFYYKKRELMESAPDDTEAIIFGSSTSEAYNVKTVESIIGQRVFHGSVAGSQTIGRMALARYALNRFENLKTVIFISDFYEFNDNFQDFIDPLVVDNQSLNKWIPEVSRGWHSFDIVTAFWQLFSHVVVEKSFNQLNKWVTGNEKYIYSENGDVFDNRNAEAVTVSSERLQKINELKSKNPLEAGKWLSDKINESLLEYKKGALKNFKYSERAEAMYLEIIKTLKERGVRVVVVASPYQPLFKKKLFEGNDLADSYKRWSAFVQSLKVDHGVDVVEAQSSENLFPAQVPFWRDGVHYSSDAAVLLLRQIP